MAKPDRIALSARYVAALYEATRGRPNTFRQIRDVAERAKITDGAQIEMAWRTAEAADLVIVQGDHSAMLTEKGRQAAR
jgi:hypothetical protein